MSSRWDALKPDRRHSSEPNKNKRRNKHERAAAESKPSPDRHGNHQHRIPMRRVGEWDRILSQLSKQEDETRLFRDISNTLTETSSSSGDTAKGKILLLLLEKPDPPQELVVKFFLSRTTQRFLDGGQIQRCLSILLSSSNKSMLDDGWRIRCVCGLVRSFSHELPPEQTATEIVDKVLLPVLQKDDDNNDLCEQVLGAIACLLRHTTTHALALLSPLLVQEDLEEMNPIGMRLVRVLESNLPASIPALMATLEAIQKLETRNLPRVCFSTMKEFFFANASPHLLRAVLCAYPKDACLSLQELFLGNMHVYNNNNNNKKATYQKGTSVLLDFYHSSTIRSQASDMVGIFVESLPLDRWLDTSRPMGGSMQLFRQRVENALVQLLRIILSRQSFDCSLVRKLMPRIPSNNSFLTQQCMETWSCMARQTTMNGAVATCFIDCMGGRPLPRGGISPMAPTLRLWLSHHESETFRNFLWSSSAAVKILGAWLYMQPETVLTQPNGWNRFRSVVKSSDNGIWLIAKLASGRKEQQQQHDNVCFGAFVLGWLERVLADTTTTRTIALPIYASLLDHDWCSHRTHLRLIQDACGSIHANERSCALKALGSICCLADDDVVVARTTHNIVMLRFHDKNAIVRSMALFAAGNLAMTLLKLDQIPFEWNEWFDLCNSVAECLHDSNDKVVGNAIRTVGHAGRLLPPLSFPLFFESVLDFLCKIRKRPKKHVWGACHAMGLLLTVVDNHNQVRVYATLVSCLEQHEKVVLAAANAICKIPRNTLAIIGNGTTGKALAHCCNHEKKTTIIRNVMLRLLNVLVVSDAHAMLGMVTTQSMEDLYEWMVEQDEVHANAYEVIAVALQRGGSVDLQQKFTSRAAWKRRQPFLEDEL